MTHLVKRPRKIQQLKNDIISCMAWNDNTFSELTDAYALAKNELWHRIEKQYNIPCPTCPKPKRHK